MDAVDDYIIRLTKDSVHKLLFSFNDSSNQAFFNLVGDKGEEVYVDLHHASNMLTELLPSFDSTTVHDDHTNGKASYADGADTFNSKYLDIYMYDTIDDFNTNVYVKVLFIPLNILCGKLLYSIASVASDQCQKDMLMCIIETCIKSMMKSTNEITTVDECIAAAVDGSADNDCVNESDNRCEPDQDDSYSVSMSDIPMSDIPVSDIPMPDISSAQSIVVGGTRHDPAVNDGSITDAVFAGDTLCANTDKCPSSTASPEVDHLDTEIEINRCMKCCDVMREIIPSSINTITTLDLLNDLLSNTSSTVSPSTITTTTANPRLTSLIIDRIWNNRILWLIHASYRDIMSINPNELCVYQFHSMDIIEMRAVFAVIKEISWHDCDDKFLWFKGSL